VPLQRTVVVAAGVMGNGALPSTVVAQTASPISPGAMSYAFLYVVFFYTFMDQHDNSARAPQVLEYYFSDGNNKPLKV